MVTFLIEIRFVLCDLLAPLLCFDKSLRRVF